MNPHLYCEQRTAASGSSFYHSFRCLKPAQRRAITALYAFCREVDDAVDDTDDPIEARDRLDFWRSEINALDHGAPTHPISLALQDVRINGDSALLQSELLHEIIDGMEMDLERDRYANFTELRLYCYRAASVVGLLAAEIFGYQDRRTLKYAHDLGMAFQLTNIIRDVGDDARRGRIYLPQDELARFDVPEAALLAGTPVPGLDSLMRFQAQRAQEFYHRAYAQLPDCDRKAQRPGLIMAAIYRTLLGEITRADFPVLGEPHQLGRAHKLWIVLVTWLRTR